MGNEVAPKGVPRVDWIAYDRQSRFLIRNRVSQTVRYVSYAPSVDLMLLRMFQRQVESQCKIALRSHAEMAKALEIGDLDLFWGSCQGFLTATANLSKALWGQKKRDDPHLSERRKPLRESLELADDSPLRSLGMRNNFDHFDERLDRWWKKSKNHNIADNNIGPFGRIVA